MTQYKGNIDIPISFLYYFAGYLAMWYFIVRDKESKNRAISESMGLSTFKYWSYNFYADMKYLGWISAALYVCYGVFQFISRNNYPNSRVFMVFFASQIYTVAFLSLSYNLSQYISSQYSVPINAYVISFSLFAFLDNYFHEDIKFYFPYSTFIAIFKTQTLMGDKLFEYYYGTQFV